jgi:hypothetical protein
MKSIKLGLTGGTRLDWKEHVRQLVHENSFENEYGMPLSCYTELVNILYPILRKKEYNCCGELITVELVVANGLRILGGGQPTDQRHIIDMSRDASYKSFYSFFYAVNSAKELDIKCQVLQKNGMRFIMNVE